MLVCQARKVKLSLRPSEHLRSKRDHAGRMSCTAVPQAFDFEAQFPIALQEARLESARERKLPVL